jgi:archaellum component FlaF (FlaF/FlaG flagellin family)
MVTSTRHHNYNFTMDTDEQHDMSDNQSVMHTNHDYISNLNTNKQHDMSGDQNTTHTNESQPHVSSCTSTSNDQVIISTFNSDIVKNGTVVKIQLKIVLPRQVVMLQKKEILVKIQFNLTHQTM